VADSARIDDLRRRVHRDPASIAFAQLAEELRRSGAIDEAIATCRAGHAIHPSYLSARVTLGRALLEVNSLDEARAELQTVLKSAPENLAAIRGLAEIFHRQGQLPDALAQYRAALALAKNDPDLQQTVAELAKIVEPQKPAHVSEGLSFEQVQNEIFDTVKSDSRTVSTGSRAPSTGSVTPSTDSAAPSPDSAVLSTDFASRSIDSAGLPIESGAPQTASGTLPSAASTLQSAPSTLQRASSTSQSASSTSQGASSTSQGASSTSQGASSTWQSAPSARPGAPGTCQPAVVQSIPSTPESRVQNPDSDRLGRQIAALQQWLDAIHVARTQPRA